jgi:hypothetical protein
VRPTAHKETKQFMKARWLSAFTIIGIILVGLGIYGIIKGSSFVFDPGQISTGKEAWYYLIIGVLMILNGFMLPVPLPGDKTSGDKEAGGDKARAASSTDKGSRDEKAEYVAGQKADRRHAERL